MKTILITLVLITNVCLGQINVDKTKELAFIQGTKTILKGNDHKKGRNQPVIFYSKKDVLMDFKSSIVISNAILKIDGVFDTSNVTSVRTINAYIVCKQHKGKKSPNIVVTKNIKYCDLTKVDIIKKIPKNTEFYLIDEFGKRLKFNKNTLNKTAPIDVGKYDIRVPSKYYKKGHLFVNR